jgi:hypothetical protein
MSSDQTLKALGAKRDAQCPIFPLAGHEVLASCITAQFETEHSDFWGQFMGGRTRESETRPPQTAASDTLADTESAGAQTDDNAESPAAERETASDDATPASSRPPRSARPDRAGLIVAGAALAACGGLVLYGVLDTGRSDAPPQRRIPTASVTYEVTGTGTADITYQARSASGEAVVAKAAKLPWRKTVDVPLGQEPIVNILLDGKGGQARCALAIRGEHAQSATATGAFGRATCSGALPGPDAHEG